MSRAGQILADVARSLNDMVTGQALFRTRLATVAGEQLRAEVVLLEWLGTDFYLEFGIGLAEPANFLDVAPFSATSFA